jgi:hypothetical protein
VPRPQFQLTGRVVHVDTGGIGPVARGQAERVLRAAWFVVVVPAFLIFLAIIRFSLALVGNFTGSKSTTRRPSALGDYASDVLAHLTANHLRFSGQTQIMTARIRDSAGQVFPVRIEGHFVSGAITYGDSVILRLRIVAGVNVVTDGENHTTHEAIRLKR